MVIEPRYGKCFLQFFMFAQKKQNKAQKTAKMAVDFVASSVCFLCFAWNNV